MNGDRWQMVERVFLRAVELVPADREAFVEACCGGDAALYTEVMELLASDGEARTSLRRVVRTAARRLGLTRRE
jgi:hypothetical protein